LQAQEGGLTNTRRRLRAGGAVEAITLALACELQGRDVTVNAVAPGAIDTEMLEHYLRDREDARTRIAGPARWINGQVLYVNGGAI
jgi:3-oxoacyl-[acyl-carrier protein] reductase